MVTELVRSRINTAMSKYIHLGFHFKVISLILLKTLFLSSHVNHAGTFGLAPDEAVPNSAYA